MHQGPEITCEVKNSNLQKFVVWDRIRYYFSADLFLCEYNHIILFYDISDLKFNGSKHTLH